MGEVNGANSIMATYASNWALVSLKHFPNASLTEMDKESKTFSQKQINNIYCYTIYAFLFVCTVKLCYTRLPFASLSCYPC